MNPAEWCPDGALVAAAATVETDDPGTARRRVAGTYADPVAWLMAEAVARALEECAGAAPQRGGEVGVIGVSEHATRHTLRALADAVPRGRLSPMRFAGAGPGSLVGVVCSAFGFHGPVSMLPMPLAPAVPAARALCGDWLLGDPPDAAHVLVVAHATTDEGKHRAHCLVVSGPTPTRRPHRT
ncbi:polyketide synthase [Streptomyces sp. NPDC006193]|uniref:polyketide synthase n=1 Tax=Streptomyces sp. NPDC006193 TaxID=3155717 RepID=UPI00339EA33D